MTASPRTPWRILIIDDSAEDRAELRRLLLAAGDRLCTFIEATTAEDGLRAIRDPASRPDCVLLDYYLPDARGDELLSELMTGDGALMAPVVVVTQGKEDELAARSLRCGAEDFVGKAWMTAESLVMVVANAVARWGLTRELRASEARFRQLAAAVPEAVWMADGAGRLLYANDRWRAFFGPIAEEGARGDWGGVLHPEDADTMTPPYPGQMAIQRDVRLRGGDGQYRWFQVNATATTGGDGNVTHWYGVNTDIHVRKLTEQRLAVEHAVSRILGDAVSLEQAAPAILRAIANGLGMAVIALWLVDGETDLMVCREAFATGGPRLAGFLDQTRRMSCRRGVGLPGLAWDALAPVWLASVASSPRAEAAQVAGLSSGAAFPITAGARCLGVVEMLSADSLPTDAPLLGMLGVLGNELGQFVLRKRAERAAEEHAARLRLALEASRTGIWTWDLRTDAVSWTPECYDIHGLAPAGFAGTGAAFFELVHPEDRARVEHAVQRAIADHAVYTCEFRIVRPDGRAVWVQNLGHAAYDADGTARSMLGTLTDVDQRVRASEALQRSEDRLSRAQRAARIGTWDWDILTGEASWTDEAWRVFRGTAPQGVVSYDRWLESVHPDDRASAADAVSKALAGAPYHDEFRVCWSNGEVHWVEGVGEVVRDASGRPARFLGTARDVTDRHASDHAIRRALAEAEQAVRARDQLVSMVSHDLRNPLGVLAMELAVLDARRAQLPQAAQDLQRSFDRMTRQIATMTRMLDELLDLTVLQSGRPVPLDLHPVDLVELVRRLAASHGQAARNHKIEVQTSAERIIGTWDPSRLERVIDNLLSNAVKYSPSGGLVTAKISVTPNGVVELRVKDQGIGISERDRPRVFEWFSRGENVYRTNIRGTGIGLAGARQIVEQHGGTIAVDSEEGKGSTFAVRLPLRAELRAGEAH